MINLKFFIHELNFTTTLKKVFVFGCGIGIYSLIPLLDHIYFNQSLNGNLVNLEAVFGIVIGLVLIFRANRAYERWWEARSLWGNLISVSRNLAIKIKSILNLDASQLKDTSTFIITFANALKKQLHNKDPNVKIETFSPERNNPGYTGIQLVNHFYMIMKDWRKQDLLTIQEFWLIDQELRTFMLIVGGCEKIKNTLMPVSFRVFSRQIIFIFILLLPWVFVSSLSYFIIIFSLLSSYIILGLEEIAYSLEQPFGDTEDHLNMEKMVKIIEKSTMEILNSELLEK